MTTTMPRVTTERIAVLTPCPICGVGELIAVDLSAILTTPDDGVSTLRVKASSKALEHWCATQAPAPDLFAVPDRTDAE